MDLQLAGKTALISGSSSGIGKGAARVLAAEGVNLVINSRSQEKAEAVAAEIADEFDVTAVGIGANFSEEEEIYALFDKAHETFDTIDLLVNNAGGPVAPSGVTPEQMMEKFGAPFIDSDPEFWDQMVRFNLYSAYWASKRFAKDLIDAGKGGAICNVTSKSAVLSSSTRNEHYASAKMGIIGLTRSSAKELITDGIRVNCIIPGYVATENGGHDPGTERYERTVKLLPTGKFATPADMGYGIAMLLSPLAEQMNGVILDLTGGTLV